MTTTEPGPVFVAGLERSGTSLMYALLASHPNIAMTRRTNLWTHFYGQYGDLATGANLERCLDMMMRYRRVRNLQPDAERLGREFRSGPPTYPRLFALLEEQYAERLGKSRWGDKSLNTERYTNLIIDAYAGVRIIHMIRDPRDRYASSKTRWQIRRGGAGVGTAEWLSSARAALRNEQRYRDHVRIVRYEDLATDPATALRGVCEFIGEPYTRAMLTLDGAPVFRDKGSNSSYGRRTAGAISSDSIGRFRSVLSSQEITFIQIVAADEMARLGYEPAAVRLTPSARLQFVVGNLPLEGCRFVAWRARETIRDRRGRPVPSYRLIEEGVAT